MSVQGYLRIKTKIDNRGVDKDIADLENKINKLQLDNVNAAEEEKALQRQADKYNNLIRRAEKYKKEMASLQYFTADGHLGISDKGRMQELTQKYANANKLIDSQASKFDAITSRLDKIKAKQSANNEKISQFKDKIDTIKLDKTQGQIENVGQSIQKQIGKISKMTLAVFGIRSAWNAVKMAVSTVSQYNPQVSTDLNYIRYVLASAILPVIQKIISFAYTLLGYINSIMSAWFGINLFANSNVKAFKKMQNSAGGTAKAAKEIKKSLQGFDEINILSDNSDSTSSASGGTPSVDLSAIQTETPAWLQWILDNKDLVLEILAGLTAGLISLKVLGLDPILSLGIGIAITGVVKTIQAIIKFLENPTWENFIDILEGISIAIAGIGIVIGTLTGNWIPLVIGAIALIVTEVIKHWDEIMAVLRTNRAMDL